MMTRSKYKRKMTFEQNSMIENLPDELLLYIFSILPKSALLSTVRCTCWRWYYLTFDATLWTTLDLSTFNKHGGYESEDKAKQSLGVRGLLQSIQRDLTHIDFGDLALEDDIYELFGSKPKTKAKFGSVKSIDYSYSKVSYRNLRVALAANPDIEELKLSHTSIPFGQALKEVIHLPKLRKLTFHDMSIEWDFVLSRHFDEQAQLKLSLMLLPRHCPLLEQVELHTVWCYLDDDVIQQFTRFCPGLRKASFTWSSQITENAFQYLHGRPHNITELVLSDRQARGPYLDFVLPHFPGLLQLTVSGHNVHIEDCRAIASCCPLLRELTFERGSEQNGGQIFDVLERGDSLCGAELNIISEGCRHLRKIQAPCSDIDDLSVMVLAEQCQHLEVVNFSQCHRLSNQAVRALSKNCLCLRKINFLDVKIQCQELLLLFTRCPKLEEAIFDYRKERNWIGTIKFVDSTSQLSQSQETVSSQESPCVENTVCPCIDDIPLADMGSNSQDTDYYDLLDGLREQENVAHIASPEDESSSFNFKMSPLPSPNPVKALHCHLRTLSLKHCVCPAESLQAVFRECPDLTYVALDCSSGLTDETIITLVRSCPCLRILSIPTSGNNSGSSSSGSQSSHYPNQSKPSCVYGDLALLEIAKYSTQLESLNILYNDQVTAVGVTALFLALDTTLSCLHSISLCVGKGYPCSVQTIVAHGLKHLTEASKKKLKNAASSKGKLSFLLLHLEYRRNKSRIKLKTE